MGRLTTGPPDIERAHEGHSGFTINQIDSLVRGGRYLEEIEPGKALLLCLAFL